jgi:hypothetical protein
MTVQDLFSADVNDDAALNLALSLNDNNVLQRLSGVRTNWNEYGGAHYFLSRAYEAGRVVRHYHTAHFMKMGGHPPLPILESALDRAIDNQNDPAFGPSGKIRYARAERELRAEIALVTGQETAKEDAPPVTGTRPPSGNPYF